jgi:hypothetical protein
VSAPADSLTPAAQTPKRVRIALTLLWVAWAVSVCTVIIRAHASVSQSSVNLAAAAVQALVIYFIGRRSNAARIVLLVLLLINTALSPLIWAALTRNSFSAAPTVVGYLMRIIAVALLFTGESKQWFRRPQAGQSGL